MEIQKGDKVICTIEGSKVKGQILIVQNVDGEGIEAKSLTPHPEFGYVNATVLGNKNSFKKVEGNIF